MLFVSLVSFHFVFWWFEISEAPTQIFKIKMSIKVFKYEFVFEYINILEDFYVLHSC